MHNIAILTHHSAKIMKLFPEICLSRSVTPSPNLKLNPSMMGNKIHNSLVFKTKVCLQITTQYVRRNHTVLSVCNNKVFVNCKFILIKAMDKWYENTMQS